MLIRAEQDWTAKKTAGLSSKDESMLITAVENQTFTAENDIFVLLKLTCNSSTSSPDVHVDFLSL